MPEATPEVYSAEGFDPYRFTKPQLRSVLLQNGTYAPSTARKGDLVDLFNQHVAPKAAALRTQHNNIRASSSGIVDMRSHRTDDDDDAQAKSAKVANKKAAVGRKSTAASTSNAEPQEKLPDSQEEEKEQASRKRGPGRPRKSAPAYTAATSKTRKSSSVSFAADDFSPEPKANKLSRGSGDDSAFSDHNPFQSGSEASPSAGIAAAAARKTRRKTTGGKVASRLAADDHHDMSDGDRKLSLLKSTTMPDMKNYMDRQLAASTLPRIIGKAVKNVKATNTKDDGQVADVEDEEDYSEEDPISPSVMAKARMHQRAKASSRYAHEDLTTFQKLSQILWSIVALSMLAYVVWYARESRTIGYCDTGSSTNGIIIQRQLQAEEAALAATKGLDDDDAISIGPIIPERYRPTCAPCPLHADCIGGKLLGCSSQDYVLQPSWLDMIPLSSSALPLSWASLACIPDTQKLVLASELALAINYFVTKWKGDVLCGYEQPHESVRDLVRKSTLPEIKYAVPKDEVRKHLFETHNAQDIDEEYFSQLWDLAMDDLASPGSNVAHLGSQSVDSLNATLSFGNDADLLVANAPILSIACSSRLALRAWLKKTRIYFFLAASLVLSFAYFRRNLRLARLERAKVSKLVQEALSRLQEQEYNHAVDPVVTPDSFLPTSHLRDHVLRSEHSTKARQRLWKKVAKVVEENSNVRTRQANVRGEWLRVWEWVGVVVGSSMSASTSKRKIEVDSPVQSSPAW